VVVTGRAERYVDVQTVQDHVDACFQASLAGIDLAKCRKPGVPAWEGKGEVRRGKERERERKREDKRERKTEQDRAKEDGEKKIEITGEDERGNRGDHRVGPIAGRSLKYVKDEE